MKHETINALNATISQLTTIWTKSNGDTRYKIRIKIEEVTDVIKQVALTKECDLDVLGKVNEARKLDLE